MCEEVIKPTILIVDDVLLNLDALKDTLENNYIIRAARNGSMALQMAKIEPKPDLILLDIIMPGMDGYEVCRQLKLDYRTQDIPVIFITAKSDSDDELVGLQMGAVDYITKPFSSAIVKTRVSLHLSLAEKNRRLFEINKHLNDSMEQLSSSEERFRILVQTIPDIVYRLDEKGLFTFLNKSIERLGYHQSDLIGKHFSEIIHSADLHEVSLEKVLERTHDGNKRPDQKLFNERRSGARMTIGMEIRLKILKGNPNRIFEVRNIGQEVLTVEVNSTGLYGEVDKPPHKRRQYVGTVGVIRDITDRLKVQNAFMEEKKLMRQLIDAVPLPIFFFERPGKLIFSNNAFQKFIGISENHPEVLQVNGLFCMEDQAKIESMLSSLYENPDHDRLYQKMELRSGDGQKCVIDITLIKFQKSAEAIPTVIGVLVDVTEQKAITTKLVLAREYAENMTQKANLASQAKGDFLANMSHEIRTPLNGVIGLTYLCLQTELTGQQQDYLLKINISAKILLQLINDILDFSKIEAGKLTIEDIEFTLDEILGGVVAILSVKSQEKELELLLDIKRDVPHYLRGDPYRLGQILTNLAGNAIKFTEKGEIAIIVEVLEETGESVLLQFTVRDTGVGMTATQMGKLFQEFSQGDNSITRKYGGTGLGLAISKRLVMLMGGQIGVEQEPGGGSRFLFTTRLHKVADRAMARSIPKGNMGGLHILVVDDNVCAQKIMAEHLEVLSCYPVCVGSGEKALEMLSKAATDGPAFDLVLLDWKMPGMNGLAVARHIKQNLALIKPPKIIMATAYGQEYFALSQEDKNLADAFLMKPVNLPALLNSITSVFGYEPNREVTNRLDSQRSHFAGAKVLLAEDNEINQQVARELLEQVGIVVTVVNNGQEAVNQLDLEHFDAVLMDLQMPIMDGLAATRIIRHKINAQILPIIAMTANAIGGDREKCLDAGMNDHIAKPVEPGKMYAILAKWLTIQPDLRAPPAIALPSTNMNLPMPPMPGIDLGIGLLNVGGNTTLYRNVLRKFARNHVGDHPEMVRCLAAGNLETLERLAHSLKGVSATLGISRLAALAAEIEKQTPLAEGLVVLPELLVTAASELAQIISAIETTLVPLEIMVAEENQPKTHVSHEKLEHLLRKIVALLFAFDSSAEKVMTEIALLVRGSDRQKKLGAIEMALASYDYETCLTLFHAWAQEEGIHMEADQPASAEIIVPW